MLLVVIAGLVGAGKSTVGQALADLLQAPFVSEPVEEWLQSQALQDFYATGNALPFQLMVLDTRIAAFQQAVMPDTLIVVCDRWLEEDYDIAFANFHLGKMTPEQFELYNTEFNRKKQAFVHHTVLRIWLDVSPAACLQRIHQRGRVEEQTITLSYLEALLKYRTIKYDIILPNSQNPKEVAINARTFIPANYLQLSTQQ
jgi:deoxyadenosine/deoxycytidine kinase